MKPTHYLLTRLPRLDPRLVSRRLALVAHAWLAGSGTKRVAD